MGTVYFGDLRELVVEPGEALDRPYILCPLHDDKNRPSMRVYADGAKCFTCGGYLNRTEFSRLFDEREITSAKLRGGVERKKSPTRVPLDPAVIARLAHESLVRCDPMGPEHRWLAQRGIHERTITYYGLGHNGVAFTLPVYNLPPMDPDNRVMNVRYRRDDVVAPFIDMKYWGLRGYNDLMLYPFICDQEVAFLTEGEFDALLLREHGLPAFSWINGSSIMPTQEQWQHFFPNLQVLVRVGDQDAAGRKGSEVLLHGLNIPGFDATRLFNSRLPASHHRPGFCDFFPERPVHNVVWDQELGKDVTAYYQKNALAFDALIEHLEGFK